jgi:predicted ferric reductase
MSSRWPAAFRVMVYLALILTPVLVVTIYRLSPGDLLAYNLGRCLALLAFVIMVLQVALAARLKWIESSFGLNLTFPFHRRMGLFAAILLLIHPLLMMAGGGGWELVFADSWYIWVGKGALVLLLVNVGISVWRVSLGLSFEKWRWWHDLLGLLVLVLGFIHSWNASIDFSIPLMKVFWVTLLVLAVALFVQHRFTMPWLLRLHPYKVQEVSQEAKGVWTITFVPPEGNCRFDFIPGQFQFVTWQGSQGLPAEEHHFTIASSPTETGFHASTIKASGDFSARIGQARPGDAIAIQAPFGRFSYLVHPEARDLVFIAGGIGITPLMSNLRHMRDTEADRRVRLLYSNRSEADIVFKEELNRMAGREKPSLEVVHILTQPSQAWHGETGRLDREKVQRLGGDRIKESMFMLCCPPPMIQSLVAILQDLGVPVSRISYEYFSL